MIYTCDQLFIGQYIQLRTLLIHLCLKSPDVYSFNIFSIITLSYQMYIEYEIYNLAYNTRKIFSMTVYSYMEQWVSGMMVLHSWIFLVVWDIDYM